MKEKLLYFLCYYDILIGLVQSPIFLCPKMGGDLQQLSSNMSIDKAVRVLCGTHHDGDVPRKLMSGTEPSGHIWADA